MRYFILLLLIYSTAFATTITLTDAQVAKVLADNPCDVCPDPPIDPPIDPPPVEPPIDPPPTQCNHTTLPTNVRTWQSWWGVAFPGPRYQNGRAYGVPPDGFLSIRFETRGVVDTGSLLLNSNTITTGVKRTSISRCRGDLDVAPECYQAYGEGGNTQWSTANTIGACQLEPNTTYYWNITFTKPNGGSFCTASRCYITYQHSNF